MYLKVLNNFLTNQECDELNKFTFKSIKDGLFDEGKNSESLNPKNSQIVSRFNKEIVFPEISKKIMLRIQTLLNISEHEICTEYHKSGIIVSVTFKGAGVIEHKDNIYKDNCFSLRCNITTNQPKNGAVLYVDRNPIILQNGDLYLLDASEHKHFVSRNLSDEPRVLWQFTFNCPLSLREKIFK